MQNMSALLPCPNVPPNKKKPISIPMPKLNTKPALLPYPNVSLMKNKPILNPKFTPPKPLPAKPILNPKFTPNPLPAKPILNPKFTPPNPLPAVKTTLPSYTLDSSNVQTLYKDENVLKALNHMKTLHKILIQNTKVSSPKLSILKAFTKQIAPEFICLFDIQIIGKHITFYCKNSSKSSQVAFDKLCKTDNLMLKFESKGVHVLLPITLIVRVANPEPPVDYVPRHILLPLLIRRIIKNEESPTTVNLSRFEKLSGIGQKIYIDISIPTALNLVLNIVRSFAPKILNLSYNRIETLIGCKRCFNLDSIDLSHNNIKSLDDLAPLMNRSIKNINLSGNPVIKNFPTIEDYYQKIAELFPTLENKEISPFLKPEPPKEFEVPEQQRNFIICEEALYLVDQFMEHFFTLYDEPLKRKNLEEMYHSTAIFSLSSHIIGEQKNLSQNTQRMKHHAHNILNPTDRKDFAVGPSDIIRKLCYLPPTEHHAASFTVDVLHYVEDHCCMFSITGIFRESLQRPEMYSFSRTFTLLAGHKGEFFIANDLLNISNCPSTMQITKFFIRKKHNFNLCQPLPPAITEEVKNGYTAILIEVTALHVDHARSLLERSQWNIREALETFVHDVRFDMVSEEWLMQDEVRKVVCKDLPLVRPGMDSTKLGKLLKNMENLKEDQYYMPHNITDKPEFMKKIKLMLESES